MDRENQARIISEMCEGLRTAMFEKLDRIPERWEGMELRELVADTARENFTSHRDRNGRWTSRKDNRLGIWRDYNNDRAICNL